MKRICYLLIFFLTGFSIKANQESMRNTYLVAGNNEVSETYLDLPTEPAAFWPETERETPEFNCRDLIRTQDLF